jgi:hypothetical protein
VSDPCAVLLVRDGERELLVTTDSAPVALRGVDEAAILAEGGPISMLVGQAETFLLTRAEVQIERIVRDETAVVVTGQGARGTPGPPGPSTGSDTEVLTAGQNLSGQRVVRDTETGALYADHNTISHAAQIAGITLGAVLAGGLATVRHHGEIDESSWSWTPGATLFLGSSGQITESIPTSGFNLRVGYAVTATRMYVLIGEPILLA